MVHYCLTQAIRDGGFLDRDIEDELIKATGQLNLFPPRAIAVQEESKSPSESTQSFYLDNASQKFPYNTARSIRKRSNPKYKEYDEEEFGNSEISNASPPKRQKSTHSNLASPTTTPPYKSQITPSTVF